MLNIHHFALCPHYNEEGRDSFDSMLAEKDMPGIALENDTAFVEVGGKISFVRSDENRNAFMVKNNGGVVEKKAVLFEEIRQL